MKTWRRLTIPYLVWGTVMLLLPMLLIVFYSLIQPGNEVTTFRVTFANFIRFFTDKDFLLILVRSLTIALKTTLICLVIGYPIAYWISRCSARMQNVLIMMITLPMWINMLVRTYAWIGILSEGGPLSVVLGWFGIHTEILYTETAVLIGMVYNFLPYMILQIHTSLTKMDPSLVEAANDLGASPFQTFWRVIFPLSLPGVISGVTLVFLPAISAFFIPKLLGGGSWFLIGNVIENQFITVGEWNFGSAISVIMAMVMMLLMTLVRKADRKGTKGGKA
ncbi:ABC transporter permease [Allobaculum stercoricanis]|uniref:ABC transporter permease n=1 Tax=Allobaculum stercoricanis TaxID=174709 RepID=UPI0003635F11|nr:ABC transporter permease [Allobaculum stercoricanis]